MFSAVFVVCFLGRIKPWLDYYNFFHVGSFEVMFQFRVLARRLASEVNARPTSCKVHNSQVGTFCALRGHVKVYFEPQLSSSLCKWLLWIWKVWGTLPGIEKVFVVSSLVCASICGASIGTEEEKRSSKMELPPFKRGIFPSFWTVNKVDLQLF